MVTFTIVWLCVYVPFETYVSAIGAGLFTFGYLIDVVGMLLMAAGVAAERYWAVEQGHSLRFGLGELVAGPVLTVLAMAALAGALWRTRRT